MPERLISNPMDDPVPAKSEPTNSGSASNKPAKNKLQTGDPAQRVVRSRFQPQPQTGLRLEPRDEQLLCDLFLQRAMARGHLQALYFTSLVRCNARLRQLFDHSYVSRYYLPAAPYGAQAIYSLGKNAVPIVARRLEMELPEVQRHYRRTKTPTFIEHTLAIVDVWIAFREAAKQHPNIQIERWLAEMLCRHEYEIRTLGGRWVKEAFKPDAFVRLSPGGSDKEALQSFFIEVDLGHTSSSQFARKLFTHQRYGESGLFAESFGCQSFHTLVITVGARRLQNLLRLVEQNQSSLFWFTTLAEMQQLGVLERIWQRPRATEKSRLYEEGS